MLKFFIFMVIWITGCAFVDYVVPDIANCWKMTIGYFVGAAGLGIANLLSLKLSEYR